jgi:ABC-type phosphate transport system substrate-binding protein
MRNIKVLLALTVSMLLSCAIAGTADIKIIANASVGVSAITADELKAIFLATKSTLSDGSRAEPVLEKGGATHEAFLKAYIGKTDAALETYYRSLVFTGRGSMPKTLAGDAEVVAYVAKTKGAIGYVSSGASTAGVKTLEVK